jgi:hypothetical protein
MDNLDKLNKIATHDSNWLKDAKKRSILKGNKLIAKFMGAKIDPETICNLEGKTYIFPKTPSKLTIGGTLRYDEKWLLGSFLKPFNECYHTSWNWLMPVVERISKILDSEDSPLDALFEEENEEAMDYYVEFNEVSLLDLNITDLYNTIVEFIKWYNKTKKQ